jgi:hypothetical protein
MDSFGRGISLSQGRYLHTGQHKHTQTSMPQVGFEPTIPVFEWAKTVHALDRAATVIGCTVFITNKYITVWTQIHQFSRLFSIPP